jgi:hypothetical protein
MYILWIYIVHQRYIILKKGTAPPNHGLEDNRPDVHDEADFDIPDTQAVLERFMSNMSKLVDDEYQSLSDLLDSLPDPSIQLIKSADFKVEDVNVDLHKRVAAAIAQGKFNSHNMRESRGSGPDILAARVRGRVEGDSW